MRRRGVGARPGPAIGNLADGRALLGSIGRGTLGGRSTRLGRSNGCIKHAHDSNSPSRLQTHCPPASPSRYATLRAWPSHSERPCPAQEPCPSSPALSWSPGAPL
jgi:hypothetical protein